MGCSFGIERILVTSLGLGKVKRAVDPSTANLEFSLGDPNYQAQAFSHGSRLNYSEKRSSSRMICFTWFSLLAIFSMCKTYLGRFSNEAPQLLIVLSLNPVAWAKAAIQAFLYPHSSGDTWTHRLQYSNGSKQSLLGTLIQYSAMMELLSIRLPMGLEEQWSWSVTKVVIRVRDQASDRNPRSKSSKFCCFAGLIHLSCLKVSSYVLSLGRFIL